MSTWTGEDWMMVITGGTALLAILWGLWQYIADCDNGEGDEREDNL